MLLIPNDQLTIDSSRFKVLKKAELRHTKVVVEVLVRPSLKA